VRRSRDLWSVGRFSLKLKWQRTANHLLAFWVMELQMAICMLIC
jgi:hypothetical protein